MQCPNCQHTNTPTAKFCENCGFKLQTTSNTSQASVSGTQPTTPYTPSPTTVPQSSDLARLEKLVPKEFAQRLMQSRTGRVEGERRIVTILFSDVKGSTAIGDERDPEELMDIMNGAFDLLIEPVYRYEGTLARLMGDAILAFFGAPIAHEDDPERACLAALAMQQNIAQYAEQLKRTRGIENFAVRVGINTGLVVVGEVGSDLRVEYTAMGDAINLASRMEQAAEPGTIAIAENTARLARHALELEPLGALELKGKAEPVNAYRVVGIKAERESTRGLVGLTSPLVGRAREFETLQDRMHALQNGRGQIIAVIGEAGLGKSRLVAEIRKQFSASENQNSGIKPVKWYEGRSLSYETQTPYAPFVNLFHSLFEIHARDTDDTAYAKIQTHVKELGLPADELAPFLGTLLGLELQGEALERVRYLMPPFLRGRIFQTITQVLGAHAAHVPTVIVFEDLHWADASSLQVLQGLLTLSENAPLLFLILMRPNKTDPAWHVYESARASFGSHMASIELQPLDENASRELVANLLEIEDLPASVRALILQKAEGNPFYVEEVIRSLLDQKLVVRDGEHWRATREIANIALPDTLAGVITARLDRLDEEAKRTAQTASILGREFEFALLTDLYESPATLEPSLDTLQARELVRVKADTAQRAFLFKHALTQETAYNSMLLSKRRALHKRAAAYLTEHETERVNEIARHWLDAQENERALPYLLQAAERAARAYATTEAIAYYTRAKEIAHTLRDVQALRRAYEGLGNALSFTPELPRAVQSFQEMYEVAKQYDDALMQISALNKQAGILSLRMGQIEQAEPLLVQAEELARRHRDNFGLGEMYVTRCQISVGSSDFDTAMHYMNDAIRVGQENKAREQIAWGLDHLSGTYAFMLRFDEAEPIAAEGMALSIEIGNREYQAGIFTTQGLLHWRRGDLEAAIHAETQGAETAAMIGLVAMVVIGDWGAAWMQWQRGEYEPAIHHLQRAQAYAVPYQEFMPFLSVMAESELGSIMFDAGTDRDAALAMHKNALALSENPIGGMANGSAWADIGWCAMNLGDLELAHNLFERALSHPSFFRLVMQPRNLLGLARIAQLRGDLDAAQGYVDQARRIADNATIRPYQATGALAAGYLAAARAEHARAVELFADAEKRAATMQLRPTILQARLGAAAGLEAMGRAAEAAEKRAQAMNMRDEIANLISDVELRNAYLENTNRTLGMTVHEISTTPNQRAKGAQT